jgi:hypothetical protein
MTTTTDRDQTAATIDDDAPVTATIGWLAFLHAPHIPIAAWEND